MVYSQKNDYTWLTGYGGNIDSIARGYGITKWDFNTPSLNPSFSYDIKAIIEFGWTNNVISNNVGKYLLSYNGFILENNSRQVVKNGMGGFCRVFSDYGNTYQSGLFLPNYLSTKILFSHEFDYLFGQFGSYSDGFRYSIIDISKINNEEVIIKNKLLFLDSLDVGRQCAIKHANGRDWWIIRARYNVESFYKILYVKDSIYKYDLQHIGKGQKYPFGSMAVSPSGEYIAFFAHQQGSKQLPGKLSSIINIYNFDRITGQLYNPRIVQVDSIETYLFGLAFSPNSKFLYLSRNNSIYQMDMSMDTIVLNEVGKYDGYYDYTPGGSKASTWFGFIELAPDGRIYGTTSCCTQRHIFYINKPNLKGEACDLKQHAIKVTMHNSLPSFPNYRLGPIDGSPCDTLGIDNIPIAEFRYDQDTSNFLKIDFTNLSWYNPNEYWWDWGDQSVPFYTSQGDTTLSYIFPTEGLFKVCLRAKNSNGENTICKEIQLGTTGIKNTESGINLEIFPNPARDFIIINLLDYLPKYMTLTILDLGGISVGSQRLFNGSNFIDIDSLCSGIYIMEIKEKGKLVRSEKVIKI